MKTRRACTIGIVTGSLLACGPVWGAALTAVFMLQAFATLGAAGSADSQSLSASIGHTLYATAAGLAALPLGIGLLFYSLRRYDKLPDQVAKCTHTGTKAICIICTVIGGFIFSAPFPLMMGQLLAMLSCFSSNTISDPSRLSVVIGEFLITILVAFVPMALGGTTMLIALRKLSRLRQHSLPS